ncbi:hypothetical protein HDA35_001823 [Micromonospora purpureochromogenes]|uniref:Uncharacterized protein n=1 Tax=Micromonospora purpureochromogenes TaxID=47872 RepID=A0ABX2RKP0_9ACTN|nr:hypothetical protein [Micromonospora purpureochromogenes]
MASFGPPGQPDDPYQRPTAGPVGSPPPAPDGGYPPPGPFPPAGPVPQFHPPPPPGYALPPAPRRNGGRIALIIGLVAVLLLCPCLGLTGFAVWRATSADDASPTVVTSAEPSAAATEEPGTDPSTADPDPTAGIDVAVGDCVVNDGTNEEAELREVPCGPDTFEVLLRIPETTDGQRCRTLSPRSTANYVHDNPVDIFDYVLCLRKHS